MTNINLAQGTKVWVRLEGQKKLAVFKGPVPDLWGGTVYSVAVGKREIALDPDSILGVYGSTKRH